MFDELPKCTLRDFLALGSFVNRLQDLLQHRLCGKLRDLRAEPDLSCPMTSFFSPLGEPVFLSIPFTGCHASPLESLSTHFYSFPASMATVPDSSGS
jgi:hypothetical protein